MSQVLREALAARLWLREAERVGPKSTIENRTPEAFLDSSADNQERWLSFSGAALSAFRAWLEAEGLVVVPREATEAMIRALDKGLHDQFPNARKMATEAHRLMIAAAPDVMGGE